MAVRRNRLVPGGQHPVRHGLGFLVSGGTAFAVDAIVLQFLTVVLGFHPIPARLAAISLALVAGWLMHRTFTFAVPTPPSAPEFLPYTCVAWVAAALNYGVFGLIVLARPHPQPLPGPVTSSAAAMI